MRPVVVLSACLLAPADGIADDCTIPIDFERHTDAWPALAVLRALVWVDGEAPPLEAIESWTPLERALAYDWAAREASAGLYPKRPKPSFIIL